MRRILVPVKFFTTKQGASILAIGVTSLLILMSLIASLITGSIGIRADALHSVIDLTGAVIGLIGIRIAARPPDEEHAFGHGKAENLSGSVIGLLILGAAAFIAYEAVNRLIREQALELLDVGIYITVAVVVINLSASLYISRVARRTDSLALQATGNDLLADSISSVAVLLGLVLVATTGNYIFDPITALLVSALIARTAIVTIIRSGGGLMDRSLPETEEAVIRDLLATEAGVVSFHKLRTRKSGSQREVDVHVIVPSQYTVAESHRICDELETEVRKKLPQTHVTIHVEPGE